MQGKAKPTNKGYTSNHDLEAQWGNSMKKGCKAKFTLRVFSCPNKLFIFVSLRENIAILLVFKFTETRSLVKQQHSMHTYLCEQGRG